MMIANIYILLHAKYTLLNDLNILSQGILRATL